MRLTLWAIIILGIAHLPVTLEWLWAKASTSPLFALTLALLNIFTTIVLIPIAWRMK